MLNYLVIGASSGIGRSIATTLADAGGQVYATYCSTPIETGDGSIKYHHPDVTGGHTTLNFLPEKIDGFVYCPGSINLRPFERIKPQDFNIDFNLQVTGAVKLIQAALPYLKKAEQPSIVLFSTVAVQTGLPFHSLVSASKGAVEGLTRALAAELAPKVRVNCIAPSLVETPLSATLLNTANKREANAMRHPLKRFGKPDDIAAAAKFLLADKASWITGQILHLDGGLSSLKV